MDHKPELATVTTWRDEAGFGFARTDWGNTDVFVHASAFGSGPYPVKGDRIELAVQSAPKGPRAQWASLISPT